MSKVFLFAVVVLAVCAVTSSLKLPVKSVRIGDEDPLLIGHPASSCTSPSQLIPDDTNCTVFYECDEILVPERFVCAEAHTCFSPSANQCDYTGCYVAC